MNDRQKYLATCLLSTAALLSVASPAWAQVSLGTASGFSVLGGSAVTCTASVVAGDAGSGGAFTNTGCAIAGAMPPATDAAAVQALADFNSADTAVQSTTCTATLPSTIAGPLTLLPGVYCTAAALTGAGVLTLDAGGDANAVWIFKIGEALTGTGFSVLMANGGQACNVFWAPGADATLTTSAFSGNILAAGATGSITLTGGALAGRVLANGAVTMTTANVVDCSALPVPLPSCKPKMHHGRDKGHGDLDDRHDAKKGHGDRDDRHDAKKGQMKCDDGDDDDKEHASDARFPFESKDKGGKK